MRISFQDHTELEGLWFWLGSANDAGKVRTSALESEIPAAALNGTCESHFSLSLQFSSVLGLLLSDSFLSVHPYCLSRATTLPSLPFPPLSSQTTGFLEAGDHQFKLPDKGANFNNGLEALRSTNALNVGR